MGEAPTRATPKFTVSEAARAFRQARGDAAKVERIEDEKKYLRRDRSGRYVIVRKGKSGGAKPGPAKTRARPRDEK
jgi:hypothetical protein